VKQIALLHVQGFAPDSRSLHLGCRTGLSRETASLTPQILDLGVLRMNLPSAIGATHLNCGRQMGDSLSGFRIHIQIKMECL
jgi:hypothetical protein